MGKHYPAIDDTVRKFIEAQPIFFVGSAPLSADGHVNVSPKGLDTLRILGPRTVAYLDLTGSGIETVSHLKENARIVLMFCAFQGPPKLFPAARARHGDRIQASGIRPVRGALP